MAGDDGNTRVLGSGVAVFAFRDGVALLCWQWARS